MTEMAAADDVILSNLKDLIKTHDFTLSGIAPLTQPLSIDFYRSWIEQGHHGEMSYLEKHLPIKENPKLFAERAHSCIVVAHSYLPHPHPSEKLKSQIKDARISLYAQGEDYHYWLLKKLEKLCIELKHIFPQEDFLPVTDSIPLMERDLAYQAGMGWIGKNTCLIHPKKGSLFLLGEIVTSLKINIKTQPLPDFCGTCTRCIDICPTKAITEPRHIDARLCISYLTIESRTIPEVPLRKKMQDWLFGCDLCQTVCPWNQKIFREQLEPTSTRILESENRKSLIDDLRFLLTASGKKIEKAFFGTPLRRAGPFGLRRNALIVTANQKLHELLPEVKKWQNEGRLKELAIWTANQLK